MICGNRQAGFRVLKECSGCGIYSEGATYRLDEIIPPGHCYELLHSLIPYMTTLGHGGWFKWERHKNTVVVCCPAVDNNVCVELKKLPQGAAPDFQYRIMTVHGKCPYYEKDAILEIRHPAFSRLCWDLFNLIYPYLRVAHAGKRIACGMKGGSGVFELSAPGDL